MRARRARDAAVSDVRQASSTSRPTTRSPRVVRRVRETDADASCSSRPAARGRRRAPSRCGCWRVAGEEVGASVASSGTPLTRSLAAEAGFDGLRVARRCAPRGTVDVAAIQARHAAIHVVRGIDDMLNAAIAAIRPHMIGPRRSQTVRAARIIPLIAAAAVIVAALFLIGLAAAATLPGAMVTIDPVAKEIVRCPTSSKSSAGAAERDGRGDATVTANGEYQTLQPAMGESWSSTRLFFL